MCEVQVIRRGVLRIVIDPPRSPVNSDPPDRDEDESDRRGDAPGRSVPDYDDGDDWDEEDDYEDWDDEEEDDDGWDEEDDDDGFASPRRSRPPPAEPEWDDSDWEEKRRLEPGRTEDERQRRRERRERRTDIWESRTRRAELRRVGWAAIAWRSADPTCHHGRVD